MNRIYCIVTLLRFKPPPVPPSPEKSGLDVDFNGGPDFGWFQATERKVLNLFGFIRKVPVWIGGLVADLGHESELALPCVWRS